jgi:archaetidylinositol phosphate synthase
MRLSSVVVGRDVPREHDPTARVPSSVAVHPLMTLDRLRPLADRLIEPFVSVSVRLGLTADVISLVAFALALGAGATLYLAGSAPGWYLVAAALVLLNGLLDVVDGAVARETEAASEAGDLLDHVLDRYADIVILSGLALGVGRYGLGLVVVTGVLMTAYMGTQAQAVGLGRIYGGLLGRADILVLVAVTSVLAAWIRFDVLGLTIVEWLLVFFAVISHATALQRFARAWSQLS